MRNEDFEKSSALTMVLIATVLLGLIVQIMTWDKYALEILPIQTREILFSTSPADWERKAEICWDRKKWNCVEREYTRAARANRDHYVRLGQYQMRRLKFDQAAASFAIYFKNGGENAEAAFSYAKALAELGRDDEAQKYFAMALESHEDTLSIQIVMHYARSLIRIGKFQRALHLIETVRDQNPTGGQFMDSEYKQIKKLKTASRD